jgi:hypothetical protein
VRFFRNVLRVCKRAKTQGGALIILRKTGQGLRATDLRTPSLARPATRMHAGNWDSAGNLRAAQRMASDSAQGCSSFSCSMKLLMAFGSSILPWKTD